MPYSYDGCKGLLRTVETHAVHEIHVRFTGVQHVVTLQRDGHIGLYVQFLHRAVHSQPCATNFECAALSERTLGVLEFCTGR